MGEFVYKKYFSYKLAFLLGPVSYPLFVVCEGKGQDATWVEHKEEEGERREEGVADLGGTEEFVFL
jgi:hypothetical protein